MATKDISDLQVVQAYAEMARQMDAAREKQLPFEYADDILERTTGQHPKVVERAMERAHRRRLVEYGMWLRGGWLTDEGKALLLKSVQWWEPHPLDKYDQWRLLEIAESANPPENQPDDSDDWCGEVEFPAKDGWKVVFFYDCGELDYIDSFVMPDGIRSFFSKR